MKEMIKSFLIRHPKLRYRARRILDAFYPVRGANNKIKKDGTLIGCHFDVKGNDNTIIIERGAVIISTLFHITGNCNIIEIGKDCKIYEHAEIWIDGEGNSIRIGQGTTIRSAHLCAQEEDTHIIIGENCMISNNVEIRTSDSHPIYDYSTGVRINPARSVDIGSRVWLAAKSVVMKGVKIEDGSIVGYGSMVTKNVPENCIVAGRPAHVLKENTRWEHE